MRQHYVVPRNSLFLEYSITHSEADASEWIIEYYKKNIIDKK